MSNKVVDRDRGYKKTVKAITKIKDGKEAKITVGIHDDAGGHAAGMTVLQVASINEFGGSGGNPPARPFIRSWADQNEGANLDLIRLSQENVVKGQDQQQALEQVTAVFVASIRAHITQGIPPPNADSTIARKGSSTPLIDSSQMMGSVKGKVNGKAIG